MASSFEKQRVPQMARPGEWTSSLGGSQEAARLGVSLQKAGQPRNPGKGYKGHCCPCLNEKKKKSNSPCLAPVPLPQKHHRKRKWKPTVQSYHRFEIAASPGSPCCNPFNPLSLPPWHTLLLSVLPSALDLEKGGLADLMGPVG
ncbi:hypothetical protein HJG60_009532 [Phyllostomus discolor]|uniref:Uncharacterized protein n=1 Tax=Phyllostomus discolor TaxID=89673 RepID=A0A833Y997_9CHIR|nr:hypothetical protein HJG60_009532 [Phyllostomus discolor]